MAKIKQSQVGRYIASRLPFEAPSAHAVLSPGYVEQGQLDTYEWGQLLRAAGEGRVSYAVFSYETPVAWVVDGKPHVTKQRFSQTTSQLQALCSRELP